MKKIVVFLVGLLCPFSIIYAQQDLLDRQASVNYNQVKLEDVLIDLQKRYDLKFTYANDQLFLERKVSLFAENQTISEILNKLFTPLQIEYHLINNNIILKPIKAISVKKPKTSSISGIVREKGSLESLPGASVYIPELKRGTITNNYGFYSINLSEEEYTLEVSFVGYKKFIQQISGLESQKIDIELEQVDALQEVVINANRSEEKITETTQMSSIDIPVHQVKGLPTLLGEKDVFKVLQLLPGVQKGTQVSTSFYVRGGNADQNLIILDDAIVYNANHLFGFFSVFNGDAIKSVQLIKGGFPARFGERLSSVLVLNMKDGNKEKIHGEAGIGLLSSRFTLEGPVKQGKSSFLVSGRRTYGDILVAPFLSKNTKAGYYFYDLNAKYHTEIDEKNRLYLSGYFGRDKLYTKNINKSTDSESKTSFGWGNATLTARWNHIFGKKIFSNTSLIFSQYRLGISQIDKNKDEFYRLSYSSAITDIGVKFDLDYTLGTQHYMRIGARSVLHNFIPTALVTKGSAEYQNSSRKNPVNSFENNIFVEDNWHIGENIALNAGVRASSFTTQRKTYLNAEPRFSAKAMLAPELALKAAYSRMNQYIHLLSNPGLGLPTDLWIPSTKKIVPQRSDQFTLGLARDISEKELTLSVEAYYKKMYHIVGYKPGASFLDEYEIGEEIAEEDFSTAEPITWEDNITAGNGKSYGAEFLLQRKNGKLSGWLGYTLSWTKFKFNELNNGEEFYPQQDRRHNLSLVSIYQVSPKIKLSISWVYSSGAPLDVPLATYRVKTEGPVASSYW
ncbi:MAG: TonB-dependent receptor, partial [Daejeonella sp.]